MGGSISLDSEINKGSTFHFKAMLSKGDHKHIRTLEVSHDSEHLAERYPHRILLAEDNLINQKVAILSLKRLGYSCDVVSDGRQVLEKLAEKGIHHYTIILMDLQMPEMDGLEATKEIYKAYGENTPKIIALTANAFESDRETCLQAGMSELPTQTPPSRTPQKSDEKVLS